MQSIDILRNAHFSNSATGIPPLALVHSEEISTASSGVSLLCKTLIFCAMLILATPLLEHHMSGYPHTAGINPLTGTPIHATEYKPLFRHTPHLKVHLSSLWRALKRSELPVAG